MKKLLFLFLIPLPLSATAQKPKEDFKGKLLYYLDKLNANGKVDSANCFAVQIKINNVGLIEKTTIFYEDSTGLRSISEEQFSNLYSRTDLLKDEKNKIRKYGGSIRGRVSFFLNMKYRRNVELRTC